MTRRGLTPEETALWRNVARGVRPLKRRAPGRQPDPADRRPVAPGPSQRRPAPLEKQPSLVAGAAPLSRRAAPDPFAAGDPKIERRVRRGKMDIDASFDLHGHNQASARAALYGFILEARARGYACVLIITGKGVQNGGAGVLRARFYDWLREDAFRQHVVRAAGAHPRHGGGGAFYVFLKRGARKKS